MKCPECNSIDIQCVDSRPCADDEVKRRRLECKDCEHRFTSYEFVKSDEVDLFIHLKADDRKEPFSITKNNELKDIKKVMNKFLEKY